MKELAGLRWRPRYVAHLGAVKGCLDYLGRDVSWGWLYGGTGHAFVVNTREGMCVSGPTAWNYQMLFDLAPNLGYRVEGMKVLRKEAGEAFADRQREAWDFVRRSIDGGRPCYGWELEIPDFYVIHGYDGEDYLYSGCTEGRVPWRKLGTIDVGVLEVHCVTLCDPAPDRKVVKDGLAAAIKHAEEPGDWVLPGYHSGPAAFELWAAELEAGRAIYDCQVYNAQVWGESRAMAVEFLQEARQRLAGRGDAAFDEAIKHYTVARDRVKALLDLHPERKKTDWTSKLRSLEGAALMREAVAAERQGLECLKRLAAAL